MLFKPRGIIAQKEEKPKNQMTLADILAFRDTWTDIPFEGFSVDRILFQGRLEKQRKAEVPALVMSENAFRVRDKNDMDESELELRRVQGSLNKLTDQNFDSVTDEMLSVDLVCNPFVLRGAVNIIFSKAVAEPVFSSLYARLCARIANYERELVTEAASKPELMAKLVAAQPQLASGSDTEPPQVGRFVRTVLIMRCQAFYQQYVEQAVPESAEAEEHLRKQNMANIKFLGELYVKSMVTTMVVASVASYSLALGYEKTVTKTTISDVDLEMVYNLFIVVGKKFDETSGPSLTADIWQNVQRCAEDKSFSMRIRCLLQNLVDLRRAGWKTKEAPPLTSSNNDEGKDGQQQQQQQKSMHRTSSTTQQEGYNTRRGTNNTSSSNVNNHPMAGARRGERVTSFPDLGQFGASNGGGNSSSNFGMPPPPPPPPPFNPDEPPPPFPGTVAAPSVEDARLLALAQPPSALTDDVEQKLLSILRDAVTDGDWAAAATALATVVPGEPKESCLRCAVYSATKKMCLSSNDEDRTTFSTALDNARLFDTTALAGGYALFLADGVANNYKEDVPRMVSRFIACLVASKALSFLVMLRDVVACAANYLDTLYIPLDGESCNWEEDFIEVWSGVLALWCKDRGEELEAKNAAKIMDCLALVKQRPFMADISLDFLMELSQHGILAEEAVQEWVAGSGAEEQNKAFAEQLEQLFA